MKPSPLLIAAGVLFASVGLYAAAQNRRPIPADVPPITTTDSGLAYSVLKAGDPEGTRPAMGDSVTVHYTGWLENGTIFDSSVDRGQPATFRLGEVIEGWNEGLQKMTPGAKHKLTIPYNLAYGETGRPPTIPPKSTLIFEVELISVKVAPKPPEFVAPDREKSVELEGGTYYQVLKTGDGAFPLPSETVVLRYAIWDKDGVLVEFDETANGPIRASAEELNLPFLKQIPVKMRPGEVVVAHVPASQGLGVSQMQGRWAEEPTIWRLELVEIVKPLPIPDFAWDREPLRTEELPGGLKMVVYVEGDGPMPTAGQRVRVHYAGWLKDGKLFDNSFSRGEPSVFGVNQVIRGWTQALLKMKVGSVVRLTIPSDLADGRRGQPPSIPPDAELHFHVELLGIEAR